MKFEIKKDFEKGKRALVSVSGGMDSRVCLQKAVSVLGSENVVAMSIYYGQKHSKELDYAKQNADQLGVPHYILNLTSIFQFNKNCCSLLQGSEKEIDHKSYTDQMRDKLEQGKKPISDAYVPFRNGLIISSLTAAAIQFNCDYVTLGAQNNDTNTEVNGKIINNVYPDCDPVFIEFMAQAIYSGTGGKVEMVAPIYDLTKEEVAQEGVKYGMSKDDFKHTWSCYEGHEKECGTCGTCIDKISAFKTIGFTDSELTEHFESI